MPGRRRRVEPDAPDVGSASEPAGAPVDGDIWDGVRADDSVVVPERVDAFEIVESVLARVDLAGRRLTNFRARDVEFDGCDLSGAMLDSAVLRRVRFTGCRLDGVNLAGASLEDVTIAGCGARLANLRQLRARYVSVSGSALVEADFTGASLRDTYLHDCPLDRATFEQASVDRLDLHGCSLDGLAGARFLAGATIGDDQLVALGQLIVADLGFRVGPRTI